MNSQSQGHKTLSLRVTLINDDYVNLVCLEVFILVKKLYHATSKENAKSILESGFKASRVDFAHFYTGNMRKKPGSLGFGVYGFLDSLHCAKCFWEKDSDIGKESIIKFDVNVDHDSSLNFVDDVEDMDYFRSFLQEQLKHNTISNLEKYYSNLYTQHELDGALIEYFINQLEKRGGIQHINLVCCATTTDMYQGMHTCIPNGIEYCVRDVSIIDNIEEVS